VAFEFLIGAGFVIGLSSFEPSRVPLLSDFVINSFCLSLRVAFRISSCRLTVILLYASFFFFFPEKGTQKLLAAPHFFSSIFWAIMLVGADRDPTGLVERPFSLSCCMVRHLRTPKSLDRGFPLSASMSEGSIVMCDVQKQNRDGIRFDIPRRDFPSLTARAYLCFLCFCIPPGRPPGRSPKALPFLASFHGDECCCYDYVCPGYPAGLRTNRPLTFFFFFLYRTLGA